MVLVTLFPAGILWGLDYYLIWKTNSPVNEESSLPLRALWPPEVGLAEAAAATTAPG